MGVTATIDPPPAKQVMLQAMLSAIVPLLVTVPVQKGSRPLARW